MLPKPLTINTLLNKRLTLHIVFWVIYFVYRVFQYGNVVNTYENTLIVQILELGLKIPLVYFNLYVLMPSLLKKRKFFNYALALLVTLMVAGFIWLFMVRGFIELGIYHPKTAGHIMKIPYWSTRTWNLGVVVLLTGVLKVAKDAYLNQQINQALAREKLENELKFLKAQVNPHFFFNTLNNLYALALVQSKQTAPMLLKLSGLMRYMLYDTADRLVPLKKEVDFMLDYISLEQLRFGNELTLTFNRPNPLPAHEVAPMLFVPLLENAFKYCQGPDNAPCYIDIALNYQQNSLLFSVVNSVGQLGNTTSQPQRSGIGLKNVQRRLELLYPKRHTLTIQHDETSFEVSLQLDTQTH